MDELTFLNSVPRRCKIGYRHGSLMEAKQILARSYLDELSDNQTLLEKGFSEKTILRQAERNYAAASGEAADLIANIAATKVQIGETQLQILQQDSEFQNEVVTQLGQVQTNLKEVNERITALRDVVSRTTVVAPDSGVVNGMQVHTVGGVIDLVRPLQKSFLKVTSLCSKPA